MNFYIDTSVLLPCFYPDAISDAAQVASSVLASIPLTQAHYDLACDWLSSFATGLKTVDALHLAVAATEALTLIIADRTLADSAGQLAVKCQLVE